MISETALRIALVIAAISAVIVTVGVLGAAVRIVCLVLMAAVALITAPRRSQDGGAWWWILAGGAAASIAGALIAQPAATLGGWIAVLGGVAVIVGSAVGFPTRE